MNDSSSSSSPPRGTGAENHSTLSGTVRNWLRALRRGRNGDVSVRDALEEIIDERDDAEVPINEDERLLLSNILDLRGRSVHDVMVPRADIIAVDGDTPLGDVIDMINSEGHSRLPVYVETLDNASGVIHAKDILAWRRPDEEFALSKILRKILFVAPSMQVLELLLQMRVERCHMALVVDEYGGVDGLVTIEDLVEEIVGEIEDEYDRDEEPTLVPTSDGGFVADARVTVEAMEEKTGPLVTEEEREDIDTLGGLVFFMAGRVPMRGELIRHANGWEFEVLDGDPRRIKRLRIREPRSTDDGGPHND